MSDRKYYVTLLARGHELVIEVCARNKEQARRESRKLHPDGHIIHVEKVNDGS